MDITKLREQTIRSQQKAVSSSRKICHEHIHKASLRGGFNVIVPYCIEDSVISELVDQGYEVIGTRLGLWISWGPRVPVKSDGSKENSPSVVGHLLLLLAIMFAIILPGILGAYISSPSDQEEDKAGTECR